jgi:hypothetical protein
LSSNVSLCIYQGYHIGFVLYSAGKNYIIFEKEILDISGTVECSSNYIEITNHLTKTVYLKYT